MQEIGRIGIPNLIGQGDQLARSRGSISGSEVALQAQLGRQLQADAARRAEQLQPTEAVERLGKRDREGEGQTDEEREHERRGRWADQQLGDDGEEHRIDVTA